MFQIAGVFHAGVLACNVDDDTCSPEMMLQPLTEDHGLDLRSTLAA